MRQRIKTTIFKVACWLDQKNFNLKVTEIEAEDTGRSYMFRNNIITTKKNRVDKSKFLVVDTGIRNMVGGDNLNGAVSFFTYCLPGQIETAKAIVVGQVRSIIGNIKIIAAAMDKMTEQEPQLITKKYNPNE